MIRGNGSSNSGSNSSSSNEAGSVGAVGAGGGYFAELAGHLRAAGLPEQDVTATVTDLTGYLAESGSPDAYEEFGAPEVFAARLTQERTDEQPDAAAETWRWTADAYSDRKYLNHYGDQGWEVEGLDRLGRFLCRREPGAALRWEYRREVANNAKERESVAAGLAPDGWEPCAQWLYFMYFKRPKAATSGPAAGLDELLAPPDRQLFLGRTYRGKLKQMLVAGVVSAVASGLAASYGGDHVIFPILIGAVIAAPIGLSIGWYRLKREATAGVGDA
ncbi:hypothetical protein [Kitasatospora sp. MAP5-34]|uniref:hypothetical protein n=1 Tax=Kitasatospora sp. MAP5-34 TaxID=3035102 RepID=UPI002473DEA2|nr:hypothetical protein [Kitasatospora sp. MAP5-34]MDH6576212.1 hypothetical protein [Kitasatospora sp. MAP5-34]